MSLTRNGLQRTARVLAAPLFHRAGVDPRREIAKQLAATAGSVSAAIKVLSSSGLIERVPAPGSRRKYYPVSGRCLGTTDVRPARDAAGFAACRAARSARSHRFAGGQVTAHMRRSDRSVAKRRSSRGASSLRCSPDSDTHTARGSGGASTPLVWVPVWLPPNPVVFGKPAHHRTWASRAMRDEQLCGATSGAGIRRWRSTSRPWPAWPR